MEEEIDLKEFLYVFWKKKIHIILLTLIFSLAGAIYSIYYKVPMYEASTTVLLAQNNVSETTEETNEITQTDITLNKQLVSTYSELIKSKTNIKQVLENLEMPIELEEDIRENIKVNAVSDTQVIKITYYDENAETAFKIANELLEVFCEKVKEIYGINNIYIVDRAEIAEEPYNINHIRDILVFGIIGMTFCCVMILIFALLDTTVKTAEDINKSTNLNVLAQIPEIKVGKYKKEIIAQVDPKSPISEVFKTIRTNLQFMKGKTETFSLLVTSTMPGEGKSWVSSNLGVTFAQSNKKVIIIDSDMRKGRLHTIFGTNIFPGLSNYLSEKEKTIKEYIIKTDIENLCIIPSGSVPANPSELLESERMVEGLEELKKEFDIIIFDSTPCMLVTDSVIISRIVDTSIIITSHKNTKIENLKLVQKNIENVGGRIAGAIINKIPISLKKYNSKYYYYGNREKHQIVNDNDNETSKIEDNVMTENKEEQIENNQEEKDTIVEQIEKYLENKN